MIAADTLASYRAVLDAGIPLPDKNLLEKKN
jgi:hypothetical protein